MVEHEHDEDDISSDIVMTDEDGNEIEMVIVHTFTSDDQTYAVLLEKNNPEGDGFITRVVEENDDSFLVFIEDDEEWERVVTVYNAEVAAMQNEQQ